MPADGLPHLELPLGIVVPLGVDLAAVHVRGESAEIDERAGRDLERQMVVAVTVIARDVEPAGIGGAP